MFRHYQLTFPHKKMIELNNTKNNLKFKCSVTEYEFPDGEGHYDLSWCLLQIEVQQGNSLFEKTFPAIMASEIMELCEWLECLSKRILPKVANLRFTEPCINFQFLGCKNNFVRILIELKDELEPDFELKQYDETQTDWKMVFNLSNKDFEHIISGIETTISCHPVRHKKN